MRDDLVQITRLLSFPPNIMKYKNTITQPTLITAWKQAKAQCLIFES